MNIYNSKSRRVVLKSSLLGLASVAVPNILYSKGIKMMPDESASNEAVFHRYPSIDDALVLEIVTLSHFNLDGVKKLVNNRPELARATWDWAFGDWETALGAASHVGRPDIANFLMSKGARPGIFTYTMLGNYDAVKAMIDGTPGIEAIAGPHGISLLQHAQAGLKSGSLSKKQMTESNKLISYLEKLGTANPKAVTLPITSADQIKYVGDYMFGDKSNAGVTIKQADQRYLTLGKLGKFGGALYQKSSNVFTYSGTSSIEISFSIENNVVKSLTITEPNLTLKAIKV